LHVLLGASHISQEAAFWAGSEGQALGRVLSPPTVLAHLRGDQTASSAWHGNGAGRRLYPERTAVV